VFLYRFEIHLCRKIKVSELLRNFLKYKRLCGARFKVYVRCITFNQ